MTKKTQMKFTATPDLRKRVEALASLEGVSVSAVCRRAVELYVRRGELGQPR